MRKIPETDEDQFASEVPRGDGIVPVLRREDPGYRLLQIIGVAGYLCFFGILGAGLYHTGLVLFHLIQGAGQ